MCDTQKPGFPAERSTAKPYVAPESHENGWEHHRSLAPPGDKYVASSSYLPYAPNFHVLRTARPGSTGRQVLYRAAGSPGSPASTGHASASLHANGSPSVTGQPPRKKTPWGFLPYF